VISDQTSCQIDFLPVFDVSISSMTNCLPSQLIVMSLRVPFRSHVYGSRFWHFIPGRFFAVEFHHTTPRRKTSPGGVRKCSSSSNVYPPGPALQVSSPILTKPFGIEALGSLKLKSEFGRAATACQHREPIGDSALIENLDGA
jgi:hypothetical protein